MTNSVWRQIFRFQSPTQQGKAQFHALLITSFNGILKAAQTCFMPWGYLEDFAIVVKWYVELKSCLL